MGSTGLVREQMARRPRTALAFSLLVLAALVTSSCTTTRVGIFIPQQGGGISVAAQDAIAEADLLGVEYMRMEQQVPQPLTAQVRIGFP